MSAGLGGAWLEDWSGVAMMIQVVKPVAETYDEAVLGDADFFGSEKRRAQVVDCLC